MMGLSDAALLSSWFTTYAIIFFIISFCISEFFLMERCIQCGSCESGLTWHRPTKPCCTIAHILVRAHLRVMQPS
jgi:hypothetical protein